jgi:ATP-dependent DNA helicase RecG
MTDLEIADLYPVPTAKISDLSKSVFENEYLPAAFAPDILEENNRTYEERLASCNMIVSPDDTTPTITGLLALGKSPRDFLPGAYIQFLRVDGAELADDVIDAEEMSGALSEMLKHAEVKLEAYNNKSYDVVSAPTHRISMAFPPTALQQLLYNAVLHRAYEKTNAPASIYWFNDRVEIHSPGGPYGNVTAENFGRPGIRDYRNPNLATALKVFGFVQSFGRGIAIARKAMALNGNPEIEFHCDASAVVCILRGKK